ncbi:subclass B1 metallo-beta-lactamase [Subsaxibacter sp. CAU 1640]|uniref:subclass B1 metallo-beta-lactamase n=1 Tax=Subsaxibacter sp. CAU 1640 TaxID=2933271 RepID=UPI0020030BA0|nr:subclass B1 metallo-beta-lactamase [Subsaxibacter sp. CAU 1640]MCK7591152.1 subclass B1 metallo-beta-lactamase [Subsaxibacter sp. CAU 1640]
MKTKLSLYILCLLLLFNCKTLQKSIIYQSENLKIEQLTNQTYRHITYLKTEDFGKVSCNGMIVIDDGEALVCDTPTDDTSSEELIDWIENNRKAKIVGVVVTHFHNDCLGGLKAFHSKNIPSYASFKTIELAKANNFEVPLTGFNDQVKLTVGSKEVINDYIGEGHTKDNIVCYVPDEQVLFGGCLIKSMNASKGHLGDANTAEWSSTVGRLKAKYSQLKIVIPGHGETGTTELLDYTIELFKSAY